MLRSYRDHLKFCRVLPVLKGAHRKGRDATIFLLTSLMTTRHNEATAHELKMSQFLLRARCYENNVLPQPSLGA